VISSLDDAINIFRSYQEENRVVWFSIAACGLFTKSEGAIESVSETAVRFSTRDGGTLVLWELFDPKEVVYFEGREIPPEDRPEIVGEFDSLWKFVTVGDGLSARSLLLIVFSR
jgi:hypothetical protein